MFDRFTDRARKVMGYSRQSAQHHSHAYIGTEHILWGLLEENTGVAANTLKDASIKRSSSLVVTTTQIRDAIDQVNGAQTTPTTMGQLPFLPETKRALEKASNEATALGHDYIGTEHLLLGVIHPEINGTARKVLNFLSLDPEHIRRCMFDLMDIDDPLVVGTSSDPDHQNMVEAEAPAFFDRYQEFTKSTAIYSQNLDKLVHAQCPACLKTFEVPGLRKLFSIFYTAFGLAGEVGEIHEKLKKHLREGHGAAELMEDESLKKEAGDVGWYFARFPAELGVKLSSIVKANVDKLLSRKRRGVLHGHGDDR